MNLVRIAIQSISANWIRTILSVLALSAAVIGVVTVASGSATIESTVTKRAILQGGPAFTGEVSGLQGVTGLDRSETVENWLQAFVGPSGRVVASAQLESTAIEAEGKSQAMAVRFTDPELLDIHGYSVERGSWLDAEGKSPAIRVVINRVGFAEIHAALGDRIGVRTPGVSTTASAILVGVIDDGSPDSRAYASILDGRAFLLSNSSQLSTTFEVSAPFVDEVDLQSRLSELEQNAGGGATWTVQRTDFVGDLQEEVAATRSAFLVVGVLGLLAGVIAIANIGLSTLRERSSEMSLRRALGAKRIDIALLMIIESQIIALIAGTIAVCASVVLYPVIAAQFGAPYGIAAPPYPWSLAVVGIAIGMATALLGSLAPAIHSLRTPVANIMRA